MNSFKVYAPLSSFIWSGEDFIVAPGIEVKEIHARPNLHELLASDEPDALSSAHHWLTFDWSSDEKGSPAEIVNLFLIALWLARPTRTHVVIRFEMNVDPNAMANHAHRLLDRFNWVPGTASDDVADAGLAEVASLFPVLQDRCLARGRLSNALFLTLAGCMANSWLVAFICHAAAAETILTCATGAGITGRLALAYACLVETSKDARDSAFLEFRDLYSVRSDIMHGRVHNVPDSSQLPKLAELEHLLRRLWKRILFSAQTLQVLEETDAKREAFFNQLQTGYLHPPP